MERGRVLLVALLALSTSTAFNHLTPRDKEAIYTWKALVKAGTNLPEAYASQFILEGKIHLQSGKNATHVKITDLTFKMYNGIMDHVHEHEAHSVPVPPEMSDLQKVFKIAYDTTGLALGISTEEDEKEFSRNMKKALASIFQMDKSVVTQDHDRNYAFVKPEHSIYGHFDTDYNVFSHDEAIEVHKLHDMPSPSHLYQDMVSNTQTLHCDVGYEYPIMHDSTKKYIIVKQEGQDIVKHITAVGAIVYHPFKAKSDSQFIAVNQTMQLLQVVPMQEKFQMKSEHFEDHLTYETSGESQDGSIEDMSNGRNIVNYEKLTIMLQHMFQDIQEYLQEDHIHMDDPDTKRGQLINRAQRLLQHFTIEKLQKLHKMLTGETLDVFYHLLPLVGTKASTLYIKDLVVNKAVNDELAVELLQTFPQNVLKPTLEWVTAMEDLMHLDQNVHWNVKKVAILSFASLIHKSFNNKFHSRKVDLHALEQPYEKYLVEYISKAKASQDYKVQMAYLLGLYNMKMPRTAKLMMPAIKGEWWQDQRLRLLSMMSMVPSLVWKTDPHTLIETIWPIYTNKDELPELRMAAFSFIMATEPSHSKLMNMLRYMIAEPDEEVYHYQYTYIKSMMHSKDPCKQAFKIKMAQLLKFMPPPSHGLSTVTLVDYKDADVGFSQGITTGYINTNLSQILSVMTTSQEFNVNHKEYMFYLKIHGIHQDHIDPSNFLADIFKKKWPKITNNKDIHIEVMIGHHGNFINAYYFNEHNLHELSFLLDFFAKDSQSLTKKLLHMTYKRQHKAMFPNDLGFPAVWEFLMPEVHYSDINIKKEVNNKIMKIHVDNRFLTWMHFRHGLSFYNPITDLWQGINRYQAYDEVLPMHFEVTFNTQQQSMQLSWEKDSNPKMNVGGLRSHVKQMVFVKDDDDKNMLVQSSPHSKDFQVVSHGKHFKNDYTIAQEDDLTTGQKWFMGVYDTSNHMSNGTFHHKLYQFLASNSKNFESPVSNLLASYLNWKQHVLLLPSPGVKGFMIRMEPSEKHAVSNIDLFFRINSETINDNYYYSPGSKWSTRATYAVKNKEQSLKTWDVNAIIDMNPGHTVNNLKMHLTRIVPGQKDYKICVDGTKKWTQKGVTGHVNLGMSQTPDGKCVKDDTVIDITMTGMKSQEQEQGHNKYGACQYNIPYTMPHYHTLQCLVAHTTVRHFVYNVKTTNVPTEFKKVIESWWDQLKGYYMSYYMFEDEHSNNIDDHTIKVDVVYPMDEEEVDVHVMTPQHGYKLTGVPTRQWRWMGVKPDSTVYSQWFVYLHEMGWIDHCVVYHDHRVMNDNTVHEEVPNDWTLFVGNAEQNPQKAVYVKNVGNKQIAVKVVDHSHTMEIVPQGDDHQITIDGQTVAGKEQHDADWIHYHVFTQDVDHPVAVMLPQSGIHFEYDKHYVEVLTPKMEQQMIGHCYSKQ